MLARRSASLLAWAGALLAPVAALAQEDIFLQASYTRTIALGVTMMVCAALGSLFLLIAASDHK
jgi:hypothetical protein